MKKKNKSWKWVLSDINSIVKSIHTVPGAFGNLFTHYKHSEINPDNYETTQGYVNMLLTPIMPTRTFMRSETNYTGEQKVSMNDEIIEDGSIWFFINGIATSQELAKVNGRKIAELFKREIHLLYNPSDSMPLDLIECFMDRTLKANTKVTQSIYKVVLQALKEKEKVVLLSHSQGGIITGEIVNLLVNDEENHHLAEKLEVYTFASATNYMEKHEVLTKSRNTMTPYIENYANLKDFIARIGVLHYKDQVEGHLFTNDSSGHLLNIHYLVQFSKGLFGQQSKLYEYMKEAELFKANLIAPSK